jgi:hypothetical protein
MLISYLMVFCLIIRKRIDIIYQVVEMWGTFFFDCRSKLVDAADSGSCGGNGSSFVSRKGYGPNGPRLREREDQDAVVD